MANASITASALTSAIGPFDPWSVPDSFTVYAYAPDYVKPLLHPHWKTQKAVHPYWAYCVGFYFFIMGGSAMIGNSMVLKIFSKYQSLRTPANMLVMNLAISDLCLMIGLIPEAVINFFNGGPWQFGYVGCQIHAFCGENLFFFIGKRIDECINRYSIVNVLGVLYRAGAFFGYSQITTLTFISWDRYNVICNGMSAKPLTYQKVTAWIAFNWIWSFAWAVTPLIGGGYHWGLYTVDGMLGTCAFDSYTSTWNNKTYMVASCFFQYGINIIIIYAAYIWIVKAIFKHEEELRTQAKRMNVTSLRSNPEARQMSAEIKAAKIAIVAVTLWTASWTPFVILCIAGTWGDPSFITPLVSELPIVMAKTSAVFNPIIYALSHPRFRVCLKELYPWLCIVPGGSKKAQDDTKSNETVTEKS